MSKVQLPSVSRSGLRKLIDLLLVTDSAFDAFCIDFFPEVEKLFALGMDRLAKQNLLFKCVPQEHVLEVLTTQYQEKLLKLGHQVPASSQTDSTQSPSTQSPSTQSPSTQSRPSAVENPEPAGRPSSASLLTTPPPSAPPTYDRAQILAVIERLCQTQRALLVARLEFPFPERLTAGPPSARQILQTATQRGHSLEAIVAILRGLVPGAI
ncbi:MAG: hypothetical protein JNM83_13955 [Myxococcales bacterium]|nr:hypothetical protein [Myxococcales bacterium]